MSEKQDSVLDLVPHRNDTLLGYRGFEGRVLIVDLVQGTLNILNDTATRIWQIIEENKSARQIAYEITKDFDVSLQEATDDTVKILEDMTSRGWLKDFVSEKRNFITYHKEEKLFDAVRERATEKKIPLVIHFDLTYRCPLRCVHCYLVPGDRRFECTLDETKNILHQLADAGALYLTFSGGEIFLRDDLPEIVAYARKLHFAVRLLTSGTLTEKEMVKEIISWRPEMVAFSIYDMDPTIHDAITRKKGSLAKTLDVIRALKEGGISLKISSVLMNGNVGHYGKVYDFAKEVGAQFQADYRITPRTDGSTEPLEFHIEDEEVKEVLNDPIFSREYESGPTEAYSGIFDTIPCGAGHMSAYISPYGIVTPCVQVPIECGSMKEKLFSEIWKNSSALRAFRKITFGEMPKCAGCNLFAYCRPCPGLNLTETGDIATPPQRVCKEAEYMKTFDKKRR